MITIKNKKKDKPESSNIYIHRGYPLGNPFPCEPHGPDTRKECINKYQEWLFDKIKDSDPNVMDALREISIAHLKKQNVGLVCFCSPQLCHGEVIKNYIEGQKYIRNWFSNMVELDKPIIYQDIYYYSVENFYQAMKVAKDDLEGRSSIADMSPFEAKKCDKGSNLNPKFEDQKLEIMEYALRQKFKQNKWKKYLAAYTKDIVEYNNWGDKFWGVSIWDSCGENHLGKILMKIRDES